MKEYKDFMSDLDSDVEYGDTFFEILKNFLFFFKSYLINPLVVNRAMKNRWNLKFSLFIGFIHIFSSSLFFLGICLSYKSLLRNIYSETITTPVLFSLLLGFLFSFLTALCFFLTTYIITISKDAEKPRFLETLAVFNTNTIVLSFFYILCFAISFFSFYIAILVFLLSFFCFGIICTVGIEALTNALVFGRQAFFTSCVVGFFQSCLFFIFLTFVYVLYSSFLVEGEPLKDVFYIILRYLR